MIRFERTVPSQNLKDGQTNRSRQYITQRSGSFPRSVPRYCTEARQLLESAGAQADGEIVRIPPELIDKALSSAPSSYTIYITRTALEAFTLEPNTVTFGTGTDMPEFIDLYTER